MIPARPEWVCGRATVSGDDIVLAPETLERYNIYELDESTRRAGGLELAFTLATVGTPHEACAFARRYGLLIHGPDAAQFREPWSLWATVAEHVRLVLHVAEALQRRDAARLDELVAPWLHRLDSSDATDTSAQATVLLAGLLNGGLQRVREAVVPAVLVTQDEWRGPAGRLFFAPQFDNLIGYAFHRLAQAVSHRSPRLFECPGCGSIRPRTHGNRVYCDERCAQRTKKRRHRAHKLGAAERH